MHDDASHEALITLHRLQRICPVHSYVGSFRALRYPCMHSTLLLLLQCNQNALHESRKQQKPASIRAHQNTLDLLLSVELLSTASAPRSKRNRFLVCKLSNISHHQHGVAKETGSSSAAVDSSSGVFYECSSIVVCQNYFGYSHPIVARTPGGILCDASRRQ